MDSKFRKLITCHRAHHPIADIVSVDVKREKGGRDLIQLELTYKITFYSIKKPTETLQ